MDTKLLKAMLELVLQALTAAEQPQSQELMIEAEQDNAVEQVTEDGVITNEEIQALPSEETLPEEAAQAGTEVLAEEEKTAEEVLTEEAISEEPMAEDTTPMEADPIEDADPKNDTAYLNQKLDALEKIIMEQSAKIEALMEVAADTEEELIETNPFSKVEIK